MRKKLISLLLVLCMVLSLAPAALAAEGDDVRETNFFTEQEHDDVTWEELVASYEHMDMETIQPQIDAVRALIDDAANLEAVRTGYDGLTDLFLKFTNMYTISNIQYSQNYLDEDIYDEYSYNVSLWNDFDDQLSQLTRDILKSPCAKALDKLTPEDVEYFLNYEDMTPEQKARSEKETELVDEYTEAANYVTYTYSFNGKDYTQSDANAAYRAGEITYEEYLEIWYGAAEAESDALGAIFMELLPLRQADAKDAGYDNYMEYAYTEIFGRDYSPEEIKPYEEAIKEYIMPLYLKMYDLYRYVSTTSDILYEDFSGETALDTVEPYIGKMSSELLEAWDYMRDHDLYDNVYSETKYGTGFTTVLYDGNVPFLFNNASMSVNDLTTVVHEFGHYDHYFWHPNGYYDPSVSYDLAEVHSQGLELMFSHWYPEIFDGDEGDDVLTYQMFRILYSLWQGAIMDEIQYYIYTTPDVTQEMINDEFARISDEYDVPRFEDWDWTQIPHNIESPGYYISYSVSAAGALSIWLDSVNGDFFDAVDTYLKFTALPADVAFQDAFTTVGYENPITPEYIKDLAEALNEALDVDIRYRDLTRLSYFDDVTSDDWFFEYVCLAYEMGLMQGKSDDIFDPNGAATRAQAVRVIWNMFDQPDPAASGAFSDVDSQWYAKAVNWAAGEDIVQGSYGKFDPNGNVTRQQMAVILYNTASMDADLTADLTVLDGFKDADEIDSWAKEAMAWCVDNGIFEGSYGKLNPGSDISRAQLAKVVVALAQLGEADNADRDAA